MRVLRGSAMYKNQTAPDSGGSPPTSTNSDVAAADKEGVPLDEAVGKLLEGMEHLGKTRAHTLDVAVFSLAKNKNFLQ